MTALLVCVGTLALAALLTGLVRRLALTHGVLDVPNERSSHQTATPRGGGVAIVVAVMLALCLLAFLNKLGTNVLAALVGGGTVVAAVGFADDRFGVSPRLRLLVHMVAALWAVIWLGGLPPLRVGSQLVNLGLVGDVLAVLSIVWTLNLFNFMDGIDGIATSEALFVALAGAFLVSRPESGTALAALGFAGACGGFLLWNWPPAKIFMGDVGSGYLGFFIAVLVLADARHDPAAVWIWLILGGVFFVDSTVTLIRRALRGDRVHVAHRSHAYQWLARSWKSHLRVTLAAGLLNLLWLLPCATFAAFHPRYALWVLAVAFVPLVVLALAAGAGRRELQ